MESAPLPTEDPEEEEDYDTIKDPSLAATNHTGKDREGSEQNNADQEEADSLMRQTESLTKDEFSVMSMDTSRGYYDEDERMCSGSFRILVCSMSCVLVIALLAVLLPGIRNKSDALEALRTPARIPVEYECQRSVENGDGTSTAENYYSDMTEEYIEVSKSLTDNMTEFLETFRESHFDDWGKTYEEVKQGMRHFKSTYYPPYLQDGSTMYESACGIGLNLYMTLEILQETKGIENLFVYGNELFEVSSDKANAVLDEIAPAHGRKGVICPGDSMELGFVPSHAFDLVYTGYLTPLMDPLHFNMGSDINYQRYTDLCKSDPHELWAEGTLNEIAQQRQNDWYGEWVAEMARIAKPGVPVIVEQVSQRYCDAFFDWGGVHRDWWWHVAKNNTYGWNIDPDSVVIEDDTLFRDRYHVFMLKNGKRETRGL